MYNHILVAVAFDTDHEPDRSLQAARILAAPGAKVTILHVKDKLPGYAISYIPDDYDADLKVAIRDRLAGLAAQFENGAGVLIEGNSGQTILEWAERNQVDCIVMMSHRPGLQDYFLGSTAGRVVRHAQCSVHVIR
ncbi:MAG: universal stress protein [Pseudotabrizicola sp.]|uniref:universal stress protein n=1 Tax=Pseudotabrizicola sp. TaxID=2939647 RepID=UPI002721BC51|nr:universal stress protein [Pseudotabrizicola sp.]MDO8884580.1 universal stress protein [Pseudotabrizicola sp.]MDP2083511.1 universal stress protein [Pseudotabrizicola sp.]MDZ7572896.1 universal stress protein [Pseudotabrizicola sp.]